MKKKKQQQKEYYTTCIWQITESPRIELFVIHIKQYKLYCFTTVA